ncbi:MAG: LysR family glycine cleavage system transcriptional activator [Gammaproteobacteria bacterium]|jgi:LysR family glycine cleavage system transcriptional activator
MPAPLRNLRVFCVVARKLSFKQASAELNLTPSAISHQIRDLESWLKTPLFERKPREVALTAAGSALYQEILPHFSAIESISQRYKEDTVQPCLTIELPELFASEMFMPKIGAFSAAHPHIDLRIETIQPGESSPNSADLRVVLTDAESSESNSEKLFNMSLIAACSAENFEAWSAMGDSVLDTQTLITHSTVPDSWRRWAALAGKAPPKPRQMISLDSQISIARAAQKGVGAALIPVPICNGWLESGSLRQLFPQVLESSQAYFVTTSTQCSHPVEREALRSWIVDSFQNA